MYSRYAIYTTFPPGPLADTLAGWLGWDSAKGIERHATALPGLPRAAAELTSRPRKYGAHGTIKPPFRLIGGLPDDHGALLAALTAFCRSRAPVRLEGLQFRRISRFLALTPTGDTAELAALAGDAVRDLDRFRAPPEAGELSRRRQATLSPQQDSNLTRWGYPYVLGEFRFHITLTGPLRDDEAASVTDALTRHLAPLLPQPFVIDHLTLLGEHAKTGRFHQIARIPLGS